MVATDELDVTVPLMNGVFELLGDVGEDHVKTGAEVLSLVFVVDDSSFEALQAPNAIAKRHKMIESVKRLI